MTAKVIFDTLIRILSLAVRACMGLKYIGLSIDTQQIKYYQYTICWNTMC